LGRFWRSGGAASRALQNKACSVISNRENLSLFPR
jgi:hypothetical protein